MITLVPATLLLAFALEPAPAAAPSEAATADADASATTSTLARALFERGLLAYEAGDYGSATTHWTSAYELMASDPALAKARRVLAFDLGQAQLRAYDVDGDRSRLGRARPLLEDYVAWVDRPAHTMSDDEREDRARATEMLARIDILEGAPPRPRAEQPVASARPMVDQPRAAPSRRKGTGLIVGGAVSIGVSVSMAVAAGVFAAQIRRAEEDILAAQAALRMDPDNPQAATDRSRAEFKGAQGNSGLIATATLSALMGTGGIAMVATGAWMRRRARNVAAAPSLAPGFAGATVRVRF